MAFTKLSLKIFFIKLKFNFFPAFARSGACVTFISDDFKTIKIELPLNYKTRNILGTMYGGSMYSAVDPIYMMIFMFLLKDKYIMWDKYATIDFKKPGRGLLKAEFNVSDEELKEVLDELKTNYSIRKVFLVDLIDEENDIVASFEKTLYFANKTKGKLWEN